MASFRFHQVPCSRCLGANHAVPWYVRMSVTTRVDPLHTNIWKAPACTFSVRLPLVLPTTSWKCSIILSFQAHSINGAISSVQFLELALSSQCNLLHKLLLVVLLSCCLLMFCGLEAPLCCLLTHSSILGLFPVWGYLWRKLLYAFVFRCAFFLTELFVQVGLQHLGQAILQAQPPDCWA